MKIRFYILTCLLFGGLVSCNDWLDVKPETEMTLEEMYADQQGFQDALTGAYLELKNSSAYGTELMYGTIEYLAQHWDYTAESIQEKISQFNYIDDNVHIDLYPTLQNHPFGQCDSGTDRRQTGCFRTGDVRDHQR